MTLYAHATPRGATPRHPTFERAQRLLAFPQTVDERPTVVLDRMLALLPSDVDSTSPGFLFEELFLRALDSETRALLASFKPESIRDLAETADAFWSRRSAPAPVHAVSAGQHTCSEL